MGHWPPPQYPCELTCCTQIPGSKRNTPKSKKKWWEVRCWSQNFSPVPQMTVVLWWSSLARSLWRSRQPQGLWYPPGVWWPCGRYRDHHDCWMSAVSLPLHSSRPLPSLPPGNAASLVLVVFWWETQAPSLWSLLVHHPLPQLPGRGQMTMPSMRTWWHMFKLPDKGPCKPFIPLKSFLPPCIELT